MKDRTMPKRLGLSNVPVMRKGTTAAAGDRARKAGPTVPPQPGTGLKPPWQENKAEKTHS